MQLVERLEQHRAEERRLGWQGPFREYFELAAVERRVSRLSHARIYDMIVARGVRDRPQRRAPLRFFDDELFGIDKPLAAAGGLFRLGRLAPGSAQAHPAADGARRRRQVDASSRC